MKARKTFGGVMLGWVLVLTMGCTQGTAPLSEESALLAPNLSLGFVGHRIGGFPGSLGDGDLAGTRVELCLSEVFLLATDVNGQPESVPVNLSPGAMVLTRDSFEFGAAEVPTRDFDGVTLVLSPRCHGTSLQVSNSLGTFTSDREFELSWRLPVRTGGDYARLWLPAHPLLANASRISSPDQLSHLVERSMGQIAEGLRVTQSKILGAYALESQVHAAAGLAPRP